MPLSAPVPRTPLHNRTIDCEGYRREDGLWEIDGHLIDTKRYVFSNAWRGDIPPGEPLHEMWIRLTVDDDMIVRAIECATDNGPHPACGAILPNFQRLVGEKIGPSWNKRIRTLLGGIEGCTHHIELLGRMASVALQTSMPILARERGTLARPDGSAVHPLINSCHVWREGGDYAREITAAIAKARNAAD